MKFITIGVYGFSEAAFFKALQQAGVDTFCDIRWRRGVRGAEYAFANRARLQQRLAELGIRYLHFRDLAPTPALRQRQAEADKAAGTTKRKTLGTGRGVHHWVPPGTAIHVRRREVRRTDRAPRLGQWHCSAWNENPPRATARCLPSGCGRTWARNARSFT